MLNPEARRHSISEAFHSLVQPITALHCGLEIALAKPRSAEDYRKRIEDALQIAQGFRGLTASLRDLVESDDLGEDVESIELRALFSAVREALQPIVDLHGTTVSFCYPLKAMLCISKAKFVKMIVFISEGFLSPGSTLRFESSLDQKGTTRIVITGTPGPAPTEIGWSESVHQIRMSAAENYFRTVGGSITVSTTNCVISVPLSA